MMLVCPCCFQAISSHNGKQNYKKGIDFIPSEKIKIGFFDDDFSFIEDDFSDETVVQCEWCDDYCNAYDIYIIENA